MFYFPAQIFCQLIFVDVLMEFLNTVTHDHLKFVFIFDELEAHVGDRPLEEALWSENEHDMEISGEITLEEK
jgi:hypothetical protein